MLNVEQDDGLESTYLVTPSHLCQNPSHAHHQSHHLGFRFPVADTVVEESTGGSIVTVISNSTIRTNDFTPDIILTHSDSDTEAHQMDDHLSNAARSSSIKSIDQNNETNFDQFSAMTSSSSPLPQLLSSIPSVTTAQATEQMPNNNNEAGTDSIQINSFSFRTITQTHNYGLESGEIFMSQNKQMLNRQIDRYKHIHTRTHIIFTKLVCSVDFKESLLCESR